MWTTDSNGNYTGNLIGAVSGNSYALESLESVFNQDLNGDGTVGLTTTVIQTDTNAFGSTSLTEVANVYFYLDGSSGSGPALKYAGSNVTVGEFGGWTPIGAVLASDAFFPFRDNVDEAAKAGVTAVVQPGGSKRDADSVAACDEHGLAMVFTGFRHFRH